MTRTYVVVFIFILSIVSLACSGSGNPVTPDPQTGVPFSIDEGETVHLADENLTVTFMEKLDDSRCPLDVTCFWQGRADILLVLDKPPAIDSASVILSISGYVTEKDTSGHVTIDTLGYSFTLLQLDPYPEINTPGFPENSAIIRVDR